jgi:hypothetical protein
MHAAAALPVQDHAATSVDALRAQAIAARDGGDARRAIRLFREALALAPHDVGLIGGLATSLFHAGDWARAWAAYEVRFRMMDQPPSVTRRTADGQVEAVPRWDGRQRPDHLMVMAEQGLGDTLQFCRFLPDLIRQGTAVTLVAPRALHPLLSTLSPAPVLAASDAPGQVAGVRSWLPLLSLPLVLGLRERHLNPTGGAYLAAEPRRIVDWRQRISAHGFKVGLVWQGNPDPRIDIGRSIPLDSLAPLFACPDVRFISLQKGPGTEQIGACPFADRLEAFGPDVDADGAFVDTAAMLHSLDLVITVDTAIAHLAGSLGRPVWTLLKADGADWRWLHGRDDTPWYPSMRLFRQKVAGDWSGVVAQVAAAVGKARTAPPLSRPQCVTPAVPVAVGELIDKLTILALKEQRLRDPAKRANVERERDALEAMRARLAIESPALARLEAELATINARLWDIEDGKRACEAAGDFGDRFILLARSVYLLNDERARLKRDINHLTGSVLVEEKSYDEGLPDAPARPVNPLDFADLGA